MFYTVLILDCLVVSYCTALLLHAWTQARYWAKIEQDSRRALLKNLKKSEDSLRPSEQQREPREKQDDVASNLKSPKLTKANHDKLVKAGEDKEALKTCCQKYLQDIKDLKKSLDEKSKDLTWFEEWFPKVRKAYDDVAAKLQKYSSQAQEHKNEIYELKKENRRLRRLLNEAEDEISRLEDLTEHWERKAKTLESNRLELIAENEQLRIEISDHKSGVPVAKLNSIAEMLSDCADEESLPNDTWESNDMSAFSPGDRGTMEGNAGQTEARGLNEELSLESESDGSGHDGDEEDGVEYDGFF